MNLKKDFNIYEIIANKNRYALELVLLTLLFGTIGEYYDNGKITLESFLHSVQLFALTLPENEINVFTGIAFISASMTIFLIAIVFFLKDISEIKMTQSILKNQYTAVFGLSEMNRKFLDTLIDKEKSILVIEENSNSQYFEEYRRKGFAIFEGNYAELKKRKDFIFKNMVYAVITLGDDRHNIELASNIIKDFHDKKNPLKLIVEIQNKDLEILFHTKFINVNDKRINLKTFSFYDEVAKDLFNNHYIDGDSQEYINSNRDFQTIVLGNGRLIEKIIYQIALLSHLPNENTHIVHIIDKNASQILAKIKKLIYYQNEKNNFFNLKLRAIDLDQNYLRFYTNWIWNTKNLVNIIVAFDEEKKNLDIAVELYNRVYLQKAIDKQYMPKILLGIYDEMLLSDTINSNKEEFRNFYTFGNVENILSYEKLIDEEIDNIAKSIHYGYGNIYNKNIFNLNQEEINKKWFDNSIFSDKLSNIAQARHLDIKLKSMGLKKVKVANEVDEFQLLKKNQELVFNKLRADMEALGLNEEVLVEFSKELEKYYNDKNFDVKYFPKKFDTLFEKMIRMEHNRWNTYHFANGWKLRAEKNKLKKEHNCLKPLKEFEENHLRITALYDIYSFLYSPNYLAAASYKIVEYVEEITSE